MENSEQFRLLRARQQMETGVNNRTIKMRQVNNLKTDLANRFVTVCVEVYCLYRGQV